MRKRPINTLNDLDSKDWVKATKSWFIINPRPRAGNQLDHPAKFPEELVTRLLQFFTKSGDWVLDPFAGIGSTLIACKETLRNVVGIEINPEFVNVGSNYINSHPEEICCRFICGDSTAAKTLLENEFGEMIPQFDFLITSPPYWDMLKKSRGSNESNHKLRREKGLRQFYSDFDKDIGNIEDYSQYIETVARLLGNLKPLLRHDAYLAIIMQNMRDVDGEMKPIAWDLAKRISSNYRLRQEMIWCQDNKQLGCWGYPTTYVSNVHHHYCLIFQNC